MHGLMFGPAGLLGSNPACIFGLLRLGSRDCLARNRPASLSTCTMARSASSTPLRSVSLTGIRPMHVQKSRFACTTARKPSFLPMRTASCQLQNVPGLKIGPGTNFPCYHRCLSASHGADLMECGAIGPILLRCNGRTHRSLSIRIRTESAALLRDHLQRDFHAFSQRPKLSVISVYAYSSLLCMYTCLCSFCIIPNQKALVKRVRG